MDKKLLALFRKIYSLDDKALPDSISPEDFGKLIEDSSSKLFIKPEDFKKLQKTLSQKDVDLKKVEEDLKKSVADKDDKKTDLEKQVTEMSDTIKTLTDSISTMNTTQRSEKLAKLYPDILPSLLEGKNDDEIEKIVTDQRTLNKKLYGDSQQFAPADYSNEADVDKAIEESKNDKSKSGEQNALSVMKLERTKAGLPEGNE